MREVDLRHLDLNLLVVLRVLLDTRSVTRTSDRLNMSQPAVSRALAKLRTQLGDKLLVKSARGMTPTPRADALAEPLAALLLRLESFVAPPRFDPSTTRRVFRLVTTDYGAIVVLPRLMQAFALEAPFAGVEVLPFSFEAFAQLGTGQVDIVLYSDDPVPTSLRTRTLFEETYSCLLRPDHPALSSAGRGAETLSLDEFTRYPHALVSISGGRTGQVDEALDRVGRTRQIALWLPYFATASLVSASSDLIVTLPTRVAKAFSQSGQLSLVNPPIEVEGFGYRLLWHELSQDDHAATWLRDLIVRTA